MWTDKITLYLNVMCVQVVDKRVLMYVIGKSRFKKKWWIVVIFDFLNLKVLVFEYIYNKAQSWNEI